MFLTVLMTTCKSRKYQHTIHDYFLSDTNMADACSELDKLIHNCGKKLDMMNIQTFCYNLLILYTRCVHSFNSV